MALETQN